MNKSVYLILLIVTLTTFAHKCQIILHADQINADCTRLELTNVPTDLPLDISGIDLSYNQISTIQKKAFESFSKLTALILDFNMIKTIDGDVFNGLKKIRWLSMKHNQLNISSKILDVVFKSLLQLQHLDIRYNIDKMFNQSNPMVYPYFGNLHNLTDLYMDLAQNPVFRLSGFEELTNLSTIKFAKCYLNQMSNDTLVELPPSITAIYFHECTGTIKIVEADFLKPFTSLTIFNMERVAIQLEDALKLLYPFTNKTMTSIIFKAIRPHVPKPVFLYHNMTNYLIHICVKTLVLAESEIVGYENGLLRDFKSPQCLENVVLSGNRFSIALGPHLQELMVIMQKTTNLKFFDLSYNSINFNNIEYCNINVLENPSYRKEVYREGCQIKSELTNQFTHFNYVLDKAQMVDIPTYTIYLPGNLTFLRVSHYMTSYIQTGQKLYFANVNNLRYVDLSYWKIKQFPEIYSVTPFNVKYLDISGLNSTILIHKTSVPFFQNVQTAILKNAMLGLTTGKTGKIFKLFPAVEKLDISYNNLWYLDENAFERNLNLSIVNIAHNLLPAIPIAVLDLPHLSKLDLRYNRLQTINKTFRDWMDQRSQIYEVTFNFLIEGNSLKCTCETSDFIRWLFNTNVVFDRVNKNYSCTLTNGSESNTIDVFKRFHEPFSHCNSKNWLLVGIGLLVAFVIFTVPFAVIFNFRWKITFWIYRNFKRVVEHTLERKFKYDIYLSYADDMLQWIQVDFLQRIEKSWSMNVCIEDRDFQIGLTKADEIANAIAGSKHAIFIMSESYKDNEWNKFVIERVKFEKCRNYLQKIIILVKDATASCVPHELDDILQNVTIIDWEDNETGWDKLRMALFTDSF
ncbi:toll-like receptor 8 [Mytilus galloprovincialis]|uniref:Toll-like receptor 8 n=1 Tax=Mytilus galloprovincialis TaxID=29158 RepID=A0A8B6GDQ3_MYTGA|nr:toll-like receptor 8 [Mytilus galloprovincialis]